MEIEIDVECDNWAPGSGALLWERGRMLHHEPKSFATSITCEATVVCDLCFGRMEPYFIWHGGMSCVTCWSVVLCDLWCPSSTWRQWLHLTSMWSEVWLDSTRSRVRPSTLGEFLKFEFSWRPPLVLSVWAQVCLSGNRTWRHGASSNVAWATDTWQFGSRRVYVPSSFHRKLTLKWFLQVGFQSLSKGFFFGFFSFSR